jgi:tetratricopeptide (TPR) repeat protein
MLNRRVAVLALVALATAGGAHAQTAWLDGRRGSSAYRQHRWEEAASAYRSAIGRGGGWSAWFGLGSSLLQAGRLPEALEAFSAAAMLTHEPAKLRLVLFNKADALARLERLPEAEEAYVAILRSDHADEGARTNLAIVRSRQKWPPSDASTAPRHSSTQEPNPAQRSPQVSDAEDERKLRQAQGTPPRRREPGRESQGEADPERYW